MQKARSSRPLGSQGAGEGGHELGSGVKVLHLYVRGEEESKGDHNGQNAGEAGIEGAGWRRSREQEKREGGCGWTDGLANISLGDFPPQWPGPYLVLLGLPRAVALNGLRYGRLQPCSSLQLRS